MEFKKIPPSAPLPAAPPVDPDIQTREALRLMARRHLHGARGILFIIGSLMLVISLGHFLSTSGILGFQQHSDLETALAAAGVVVGLLVISCGWLILVMPRAAAILPMVLFLGYAATSLTLQIKGGQPPGLLSATVQVCLAALTIKPIREALAFHREAQNIREAIRSAAILRNKNRGR